MIREAFWHGGRQHHADADHHHGRRAEHRPPAEVVSHQTGNRPRQQNPQKQPAHDPANNPPTRLLRGQMRRQRNEHLHRHRTEADQQRDQQKHIRLLGKGGTQQTEHRNRRGDQHQPAVLQQITQWHQKEQPQRVTDLRQRNDQTRRRTRQPDVRCNQLDDRLGVVDVGDNRAAAECKQHDHGRGHGRSVM